MPVRKQPNDASQVATDTLEKPTPPTKSRAVLRLIESGETANCPHCGQRVKFQAKQRGYQVICNVYRRKKWQRVEHFHADCYDAAGQPFGEPDVTHERAVRALGFSSKSRQSR